MQNILVEDRFSGYNAQQTPEMFRFVLTEDMLVRSGDVQKACDRRAGHGRASQSRRGVFGRQLQCRTILHLHRNQRAQRGHAH